MWHIGGGGAFCVCVSGTGGYEKNNNNDDNKPWERNDVTVLSGEQPKRRPYVVIIIIIITVVLLRAINTHGPSRLCDTDGGGVDVENGPRTAHTVSSHSTICAYNYGRVRL